MKLGNYLKKDFMKVAARASLVAMLTIGAVAPNISAAQLPVQPAPAPVVLAAASQEVAAMDAVSFTRVTDFKELTAKYPFLAGLEAQVKEFDDWQGGTNPTLVDVGAYKDQANNREMVFVHITTPVQCSYEGCPLSVYMKDSNDNFTLVHQINAIVPVHIKSEANSLSLFVPGAYGAMPGHEFKFDSAHNKFERNMPKEDKPTASPLEQILPN